ncbi:MAG: metallophosphoesterase [Proteobacteria bacterium]|nr:metallophosphoesterase [Pseudomonadota bacterium]
MIGCQPGAPSPVAVAPSARLEILHGPNPWSHLEFQNDPGHFTFAIVSDLTGGYRDGVFEAAIDRLQLLRPEFIVSVGDFIEGYTEDRDELTRQWDVFDAMLEPLSAPFFYVPGNHDYSNDVMAQVWKERRGRDYYHFVYGDVLFLAINTERDQGPASPEAEAALRRLFALGDRPFTAFAGHVHNYERFEI